MKKFSVIFLALFLFFLSSCAPSDITVARDGSAPGNNFPEMGKTVALTVNISSGTFHLDKKCRYAEKINEENKKIIFYSNIKTALEDGLKPCSSCAGKYKNMEDPHD